MNAKSENEINSEEEITLYDYWEVLVKRKKILIGIFLIPLVIAFIISFTIPVYYSGVGVISNLALPAPDIAKLIGNVGDTQKDKIFINNPGAINSVLILPNDNLRIIIEAKTADIIPQAFKEILNYISNMPEIKEEIERNKERAKREANSKIKTLMDSKEANLTFMNYLKDMMKKRQLQYITVNPADLVKRDGEISLEIMNLQQTGKDVMKKESNVKVTVGMLGPLSITKNPSDKKIRERIIMTGILSLLTGILIIVFLEYIDRMKRRKNKQGSLS
jgi:hypothetical protein